MPCFLKRNIKKVDRNKRGRLVRLTKRKKKAEYLSEWRYKKPAGTNANASKVFYFRYKHKNAKRPASERIDNGQAKRLCLEPVNDKALANERATKRVVETPGLESANARGHLASEKIGYDQTKKLCLKPESNEAVVIANSQPTFSKLLNEEKEIWGKKSESRHRLHVENNHPQARSSFKKFQETSNECFYPNVDKQATTGKNNQKNTFHKEQLPKNGSYGERNRAKTRSSSREWGGKTNQKNFNSDSNQSRNFREASGEEEQSGIFKRNLAGKSLSKNTRKVITEEKSAKTLRVSLVDCFADGLHARENSTDGIFHATSTPKAMRVPTNSRSSSTAPTSHITPRVPTSDITPKVRTFDRSARLRPRMPASDITPRDLKSEMTSMLPSSQMTPPASEVSCTEDEGSMFTREAAFGKNKLRGGLNTKNRSKKNYQKVTYTALFPNKPRPWKSVVVENDSYY